MAAQEAKRTGSGSQVQAIGIDLGTTYSCLARLDEHGEPECVPNAEGEISTPSVVMFDGDDVIVGTEALRNAIVNPGAVIENSKRWMGDPHKRWVISGRVYTPIDVAAIILRKMLADAENRLGTIDRAVITVPAQFSDAQRQATVQAGIKAGLRHVDIINEPEAAALCYVLGTEGLWFEELADEQTVLVYDLGGGTFDLSLVRYHRDDVRVIASSGDLHLGGIDWTKELRDAVADQFAREFRSDPRLDAESLQLLSLEVEQCKRSLSVRPRAALVVQHDGKRKTYQIEVDQFNLLTSKLLKRTEVLTTQLLKDHKMGWAHVDVVLSTGGSSRMPMVRDMLRRLSGRTLNTSLSPDQSIAHGAAYSAGMALSRSRFAGLVLNKKAASRLSKVKQQSVNARSLGIMIRDVERDERVPFYLIPANTPLPTSMTHEFGTVQPNQRRVNLRIVESGTAADETAVVEIGTCVIDDLPPNLPVDSLVAVTISYDESARIHVSARDVTSGKQASTVIVREDGIITRTVEEVAQSEVRLPQPRATAVPATVASPGNSPATKGVPVELSAATAPRNAAPPAAVTAPRNVATAAGPVGAPPVATRQVAAPKAAAPQPVASKAAAIQQPRATAVPPTAAPVPAQRSAMIGAESESSIPVMLCNTCGDLLHLDGTCPRCSDPLHQQPSAARKAATPSPMPTPTNKAGGGGALPPRAPVSGNVAPASVAQGGVVAGNSPPAQRPEGNAVAKPAVAQPRPAEKLPTPVAKDPRPMTAATGPSAKPIAQNGSPPRSPAVANATNAAQPAKAKPATPQPPVKKGGTKGPQMRDSGEDEFWKFIEEK